MLRPKYLSQKRKTYPNNNPHKNLKFLLILWAFYISLRLLHDPGEGRQLQIIKAPRGTCVKGLLVA